MYNYPHTRYYDNDLYFLIEAVKRNQEDIKNIARLNQITYANPLDWDITRQYPMYQIVLGNDGNAYLSAQPVPTGVELSNEDYWVKVFNYDAQVEDLRQSINNNKDYINVLTLGVDNTGYTDCSDIIQSAVNNYKMKTLFFPAGTYLWNKEVVIGNANSDCVNFRLDGNAIIKSNVSLNTFLDVGGVNTGTYRRYTEGSIITIDGGTWNCSNVQYGLTITSRRPETHVLNVKLVQVSKVGLFLKDDPDGNYNSGDTVVINAFITGDKISENTGILATSKDNIFNTIYIAGCLKGIDFTNSAGNFVEYCHVVASYENDDMYENSVAVINGNSRYNNFTNLYNDTMRTGVLNQNGTVVLTNYYCYYWWTKFKVPVYAIKVSGSAHSINLSNAYIQFKNTTTNGNYVLYMESGLQTTFEGKDKIINTVVTDRAVPVSTLDFYDDVTINREAINRMITSQNSITMSQNTWYRIATVSSSTGIHSISLVNGNDVLCDVCLYVGGTPSASSKFLKRLNTSNQYQLGIGAQYTYNNANYRDLYIRCSNNSTSKFNPHFLAVGNSWSWANPFLITSNPTSTTATVTSLLNLY